MKIEVVTLGLCMLIMCSNSAGVSPEYTWLPNAELSPGVATLATTAELCGSNAPHAPPPPVSWATQILLWQRYGLAGPYADYCDRRRGCVISYVIPPELGGATQIDNLWPQPRPGAWSLAHKRALDQHMHDLVCAGRVPLKTAQTALSVDWTRAYRIYMHMPLK